VLNIEEICWKVVDCIHLGHDTDPVAGCCVCGNEHSDSNRCREILDGLSDCLTV
jgi:hypothetical protein